MFTFLIEFFVEIISKGGYWGVGFLMALESMIAPVPSEAVMPFAGFLWFEGQMTFLGIVISSTIGSIIGSLLSYFIGLYLGRPLVFKYGKYLLLNAHHFIVTEKFFHRFGGKAVLISRFVPVVRHLISIPAGATKMNIWQFSFYTIIGAGIWNAFLAYMGFLLGENWLKIREYSEILDIFIVIIIIAAIVYFVRKTLMDRKKKITLLE